MLKCWLWRLVGGVGLAILKAKYGWPLTNTAIYLLPVNTKTKSLWQAKGSTDADTCAFEVSVERRWQIRFRSSRVCEGEGKWFRNIDYYRLDGSTNATTRKKWAEEFNDTSNTRWHLCCVYKMQNDDSDFSKKEHENLKATFLHVTQDIIVMCLLLFHFHTQRPFVSHFYKSWFTWNQPGGSKSGHHLRCLLESILWRPEHLQGLPLWAA